MYKLLTPEEKKKVEQEYRSRLAVSILALISSLALFTMLAILPSLILAKSAKDNALYALKTATATAKGDDEALKAWAQNVRLELATLAEDKSAQVPYDWFKKILAIQSNGIQITNFFFQTGNTLVLRIHGVAKTRQSLLDFQTVINNSGTFNRIDFPVSALSQDTDLNFDFSLTPKS